MACDKFRKGFNRQEEGGKEKRCCRYDNAVACDIVVDPGN